MKTLLLLAALALTYQVATTKDNLLYADGGAPFPTCSPWCCPPGTPHEPICKGDGKLIESQPSEMIFRRDINQ